MYEAENTFLSSIPEAERNLLLRDSAEVRVDAGSVLYQIGGSMPYVYFPIDAVASVVTELSDGKSVESASIGREGFIGLSVFLGVRRSSYLLIIQVPGRLRRVSADYFLEVAPRLPHFRARAARYAEATMVLMAQSAACLAVHPVQERCARWLLTTADRTGSNEFRLTHEFLAAMLGVHRPTVTIAASTLQAAGMIEYHRGKVHILDRAALEGATCECYHNVREVFQELAAENGGSAISNER